MSRRSRPNTPRPTPSSASPMTMITTPPTTRTVSWNVDSDDPRSPASAPRPANTVVKPAMKMSVAGTAHAGSWASPTSPTMIPRYAGTRGMMHGARNDATPAPNNATICPITWVPLG